MTGSHKSILKLKSYTVLLRYSVFNRQDVFFFERFVKLFMFEKGISSS